MAGHANSKQPNRALVLGICSLVLGSIVFLHTFIVFAGNQGLETFLPWSFCETHRHLTWDFWLDLQNSISVHWLGDFPGVFLLWRLLPIVSLALGIAAVCKMRHAQVPVRRLLVPILGMVMVVLSIGLFLYTVLCVAE